MLTAAPPPAVCASPRLRPDDALGGAGAPAAAPRPRPVSRRAQLRPRRAATPEPRRRPASRSAARRSAVGRHGARAARARRTATAAATLAGFDCSGFVQWVFAQHGRRCRARHASSTASAGRSISDDVRPGDLVFFETVSGASHVGIALGGGEFVHAPSSRGVVRVETLYEDGYWADRWLGARRIDPVSQSTHVAR